MQTKQHNDDALNSKAQIGNFTDTSERLLRLKDVLQLIPISKSSWFAGISKGLYPKGHLLSERTRVWKYHAEIKPIIDNLG